MQDPKDWEGCVRIALAISVPPQLIAEAYGIEQGEVATKRAKAPDAATLIMIEYIEACEKSDLDRAELILSALFERHTPTRSSTQYVFDQAIYLGFRKLALKALKKMILQNIE